MCYGGLDPKYLVRDTEARLKPLFTEADRADKPASASASASASATGPVIRLRAFWLRLRKKELRHV